jgi:hypothetical protein
MYKQPRYQVRSTGYVTHGICGSPGDIGSGYDRAKILSEHVTRAEAEAACKDARRPSDPVIGTNSTWSIVEDAYVYDRHGG